MATPLTKVTHYPSPYHLLLDVSAGSPLSKITPLVHHQTTLWAWGSSLSSQAKVTSGDSHCEICHSPGAKVNIWTVEKVGSLCTTVQTWTWSLEIIVMKREKWWWYEIYWYCLENVRNSGDKKGMNWMGCVPVSHGELNMPCSQIYGRGKGGSKHFLHYSLRYFFMIFFNIASDIFHDFLQYIFRYFVYFL